MPLDAEVACSWTQVTVEKMSRTPSLPLECVVLARVSAHRHRKSMSAHRLNRLASYTSASRQHKCRSTHGLLCMLSIKFINRHIHLARGFWRGLGCVLEYLQSEAKLRTQLKTDTLRQLGLDLNSTTQFFGL